MECLAGVINAMLRGRGIDFHAANGVEGYVRWGGRGFVVVYVVASQIVRHGGNPHFSGAPPPKEVTSAAQRPIYPSQVWYQGPVAMHDVTKTEVTRRLRRVEGQVGGLLRMVEDDRYCVDVLIQINAVRAALHKVEEKILGDHVSHCVAAAFASGDVTDQRHKVEELITTIGRMTR